MKKLAEGLTGKAAAVFAKKEAEKALEGLPGESEPEAQDDPGNQTDTEGKKPGFMEKIKGKFRRNSETDTTHESVKDQETLMTETPVETSDGYGTTEELATEFSTPSSQQGSEWETDVEMPRKQFSQGKDLAELNEFVKPAESSVLDDKKTNFKVKVHVFDAAALQGFEGQELNPVVRVTLDQKQRKSRVIRGTDNPVWEQTMEFSVKATPAELCEKVLIFKVYSSNTIVRVPLIGSFRYALSFVFKRRNHQAINQFVALRGGGEDEEDSNGPIRGFLRISVAITYPGYHGPLSLSSSRSPAVEMINTADLLQYRLQFRVYKLLSMMKKIRHCNPKAPDAAAPLCIEVMLNKRAVRTDFRLAQHENIAFNQELILPMMWPTVAKSVRIRVLSMIERRPPRKNKIVVVCTAFLELKQLCQSGENGFLPVFGPSFVNFFGPDPNLSMSSKASKLAKNEGTGAITFYGRLFCDMVCADGKVSDAVCRDLTLAVASSSESYYIQQQYVLLSSFFAVNSIDPDYKLENVQFAVSIGQFGNPDYGYALKCAERSLPAMPIYDNTRFYAMPWSTYKPICEVYCSWENINQRIAQASCILRISQFLKKFREQAELQADGNPAPFSMVSIVINALEDAMEALNWMFSKAIYQVDNFMKLTQLDKNLQTARFFKFQQLQTKCEEFKYMPTHSDELNDLALQKLSEVAKDLDDLLLDPQMSIPDVLILMLVNNLPVAFARVPVAEIAFNANEMKNGASCGKLKSFQLNWLNRKDKMPDQIPAILHARFWFGLSQHRDFFERMILPGKIRYFAELFLNEKKTLGQFRPCKFAEASTSKKSYGQLSCESPHYSSDQTGAVSITEDKVRPPPGWEFVGNWRTQMTHDMWVGKESGADMCYDEIYELQKKNHQDDVWEYYKWTGSEGEEITREEFNQCPEGYYIDGDWEVDLHRVAGVDGWTYSLTEEFSDKIGAVDVNERPEHDFRRRALIRLRRRQATKNLEMFENEQIVKKRADPQGWEYAQSFKHPLHMQRRPEDTVRRKRFVREFARVTSDACKLNVRVDGDGERIALMPRIYEVHYETTCYQLRVYVLWARELHCSSRVITRSFVRAFFLYRCLETGVVKHTVNPIYNETLIFDNFWIPGGFRMMQENPPNVVVEVIGETPEGINIVMGRFCVAPTAVELGTKPLSNCKWYRLENSREDTSGALLFYSELYLSGSEHINKLPKLPSKKGSAVNRYEVPSEHRPNFVPYTLQIICYGLRNLQRYQMAAIRQPWLEITVGDLTGRTFPLKDSRINPNFDSPVLTFEKVMMPESLYFAPPIQILLFDQRTFGMQPQIGVCTISNFKNYQRQPQSQPVIDPKDWNEFDEIARKERQEEMVELVRFQEQKGYDSDVFFVDPDDPNSPRIDWWCKYYFSCREIQRAPGYDKLSLGKIPIFKTPLEDVGDYRGFSDFMDTFKILKASRKKGRFGKSIDACAELKGKIFIWRHVKDRSVFLDDIAGVEFEGTVKCLVRVYVVRALDVVTEKKKGPLDLQVSVCVGSRKKHTAYVPESNDPLFGELIEIDANVPVESTLKITLQDKKRLFGTDDIGETKINLEDRLHTKHRATLGLPTHYNLFGPLPWRDQMPPLEILSRYFRRMRLPVPKILQTETDVGMNVLGSEIWLSKVETESFFNQNNKSFLGRPLQRLALFILHSIGLVPEHVETRPLYSVINPDLEVGKLECFVDIIPYSIGPIPPPLTITKRNPIPYQLRVVVWKTRNVIPIKKSFGKPAADLYVECYLNGHLKTEKTDIHYRVMDGAGSFNWRFVVDFDYDPWEKKVVAKKKKRFLRQAATILVDPVLVLRICDNNKFKKDGFLGECILPLLGFEEGQMHEDEMVNVKYPKEKKQNCCVKNCAFCWQTKCFLKPRKKENYPLPRAPVYIGGVVGIHSLFGSKSVRGWWPCLNTNVAEEQKMRRKKNDEVENDEDVKYVTGMVDLEISLLTADEAAREPVGKKRNKPNRSPFLPAPDRPKFDNYWCLSRCRACTGFCWKRWGHQCICYFCGILALGLLIFATIWQLPNLLLQIFF